MSIKMLTRRALQMYVCLCCWIGGVYTQCKLKFPKSHEITPIFEISIGTRTVKIPYTDDVVYLEEGERIIGFCPTVFKDFHYVANENSFDAYGVFKQQKPTSTVLVTGEHNITMHCHNRTLYYLGSSDHSLEKPLYEDQLSCGELKWGIFEVNKPFSWCSPPLVSYALAARFFSQELVLGVVCYDVELMELRALHYTLEGKLQRRENILITRPSSFLDLHLREEINNFDTFYKFYSYKGKKEKDDITETRFYNELDKDSRQNMWIKVCGYEYRPIVQEGAYSYYFHLYVDVLNVLWWPSLFFGNWLKFQNAFNDRAHANSYNMFTGATGAIILPEGSRYHFHNSNKTIPAYIWVYAEGRENDDLILVFGYNSPYYEFFEPDDIIFCDDICSKISWLQDISSTFRQPALGIVFCCAVDSDITRNFQVDMNFEKILRKSKLRQKQNETMSTTVKSMSQIEEEKAAKELLIDEFSDDFI